MSFINVEKLSERNTWKITLSNVCMDAHCHKAKRPIRGRFLSFVLSLNLIQLPFKFLHCSPFTNRKVFYSLTLLPRRVWVYSASSLGYWATTLAGKRSHLGFWQPTPQGAASPTMYCYTALQTEKVQLPSESVLITKA